MKSFFICNFDSKLIKPIHPLTKAWWFCWLNNHKLFESVNMLKSNKDEDVTYPYPVYESPSPEFDIVLSSSDWSDGVNELQS